MSNRPLRPSAGTGTSSGTRSRARGAVGMLACALLAALGGCVTPPVGPDYHRPAVPLPESWRVPPTEAEDVVNTAWWNRFGDAHLQALVHEALTANLDLKIAASRVQRFAGKLEHSEAQRFPELGYEVSALRNQRSQEVPELLRPGQPPIYNEYKYGLTASWEIDLWGKIRRLNESARAELLSTKEARHTVMLTVVTAVASTYVQLLVNDRDLELARQRVSSLKETVKLLDEKQRGGSATLLQVEHARAELEEEAAQVPQIERRTANLENALSILVGRSPGPVERGTLAALELPPIPAGVPSDVLTRRPDILAAEQTLVAANARIGVAKSQYFPSLALTSMYGYSSDLTQWLFAETAHTGLSQALLLGPLLSFGRIEGQVREARAEARENVYRYLQSVQTALQEVNDSLVYDVKAKERYAALDRRVEALKKFRALSNQRFEGGESTYLDVLDADRQVYEGEEQQNQGKGDEFLALISVYKAMGGGWMVAEDKNAALAWMTASAPAGTQAQATNQGVTPQ